MSFSILSRLDLPCCISLSCDRQRLAQEYSYDLDIAQRVRCRGHGDKMPAPCQGHWQQKLIGEICPYRHASCQMRPRRGRRSSGNSLGGRSGQAHFPQTKSLDSFDFTAQPSLNKALVLELARSEWIETRQTPTEKAKSPIHGVRRRWHLSPRNPRETNS